MLQRRLLWARTLLGGRGAGGGGGGQQLSVIGILSPDLIEMVGAMIPHDVAWQVDRWRRSRCSPPRIGPS